MTGSRNSRGTMFGVVSLVIAAIVFAGMVAFTFHTLFFQHGRFQNQADAEAINLASKINAGDRVGQINELEICSRELLYFTHQDEKLCRTDEFSFLAPLCSRLADDARSGHMAVELERLNQIRVATKAMRDEVLKLNSERNSLFGLKLPWLQTGQPEIVQLDVGYITNVQSNVKNLDVIKELSEFDRRSGYIDSNSNVYRSNISAGLPEGENQLAFNLSPLPAFVSKTCSPARCFNPDVFVKTATIYSGTKAPDSVDQIPNAVRLVYSMPATSYLAPKDKVSVTIVSTGATNGAIAGSN